MKKIIAIVMLVSGIMVNAFAQEETSNIKTSKTFEMQRGSIKRRFFIDLGKGNKMQVELAAIYDLDRLENIDSLVRVYLQDVQAFKDSLSDELASKRIDYLTDSTGKNKIRIQVFKAAGSSFLVNNGDIAALKLDQDTINILGPIAYKAGYYKKKQLTLTRYWRVSFFLNRAGDINNYANGFLKEKIQALQKAEQQRWIRSDATHWVPVNGDKTISAAEPSGYTNISARGDYIAITASANVQNYKNYFVPSVSVIAKATISNAMFKYQIGAGWEKHFVFAKDQQGTMHTYGNDFITLVLGRRRLGPRENGDGPYINLADHISLSYLVGRHGDVFDKHTFRLNTGGISWKNNALTLEPVLYFHDFFKGTTPGLRLSLNF